MNNIVCKKCQRVLVNNQWIVDVVPIKGVSYTMCPQCQAESEGKDSRHGMVYQEYKDKPKKR